MTDFKLELPKGIPADDRAELVRALEPSAQVKIGTAQMRDFDAAQTLFVMAATVATIDILWHWFQAARAKNKLWDVVVTMPNGDQAHLERISLDELKKLIG
jgi:hypothetical protein